MKKLVFTMTTLVLLVALAVGFGSCSNASGSGANNSNGGTETFVVRPTALWYLASDDTSDYTGEVQAYSASKYSTLSQWAQDNVGNLFTSVEQGEDKNLRLTVNESQKAKLLEIAKKKFQQALEELPNVCDLFKWAEIAGSDSRELDIYFDPEAWLETNIFSMSGLMKFQNFIALGDFRQLIGELENGSDFVGNVIWKNADTGYRLLSLSSDPTVTDSTNFATMAVRHTKYGDYEGTLDFTATYVGKFADEEYEGVFYEFEVTNDSCFEVGERVRFYVETLPIEVSEGASVHVTFSGDNSLSTSSFTSHDQEQCFDEDTPFEMTLSGA